MPFTLLKSNAIDGGIDRPNAKPLIINGNMAVAQRGTSSSSTGYQTVDRWRLNTGTQQEQKTDAPDNFSHSMEVTGTTGGSSGYGIIYQRLESKDILATLGKTCTLSAYVKNTGTSTANVSCEIYRANATDNWSGQTLVSSLTAQAITTSWTQIVFPSFSVPTTASTGLEVRIFRYDGSNDQEWLITGIQLEVGDYTSSTLPPFQHESYEENFKRCCRYFQKHYYDGTETLIGSGQNYDNSTSYTPVFYPNGELKSAPSISFVTATNGYRYTSKSHNILRNDVPLRENINRFSYQLGNNANTVTGGEAMNVKLTNSISALSYDSEL